MKISVFFLNGKFRHCDRIIKIKIAMCYHRFFFFKFILNGKILRIWTHDFSIVYESINKPLTVAM